MSLERGGDQATSQTSSALGQGSMERATGALLSPQRQQQLLPDQESQRQQQLMHIQAAALPLPDFASSGASSLQEGLSHEQRTPTRRGDYSSCKSDVDIDVDVLLTPPNKMNNAGGGSTDMTPAASGGSTSPCSAGTSTVSSAASGRSSSLILPCTPLALSAASSRDVSSGKITDATPQKRSHPPNFGSWYGKDLKRYAAKLAVKGRGLVFGPGREDCLASVSNASNTSLVNALTKREAYRNSNGLPKEWEKYPSVTPEKKLRPKFKGKEKDTKVRLPVKSNSMLCRMLCLLTCEKLFLLWMNSQQPVTRDEQDRRAMGKNHLFYVELAKAFVDEKWKTAAGNPISVPSTHRFDSPPAPQDLIDLLAGLDLETPAAVMLQALGRDNGGNVLCEPLQEVFFKWMGDLRGEHTAMRVREDQSGGVGTDNKDEDDQDVRVEIKTEGNGQENVDKADGKVGNAVLTKAERESLKHKKDAIHTWSFCKGKAPLIIWNDILQTFGGGDNGPVGDNVIADGGSGSVSSVPGGAGVKSTTASGNGKGSAIGGSGAGRESTSSKATAAEVAKKSAYAGVASLAAKWQESLDAERLDSGPTIEELADTVSRLQGKLNALAANAHALVRAGFKRELDKAVAELTARLGT